MSFQGPFPLEKQISFDKDPFLPLSAYKPETLPPSLRQQAEADQVSLQRKHADLYGSSDDTSRNSSSELSSTDTSEGNIDEEISKAKSHFESVADWSNMAKRAAASGHLRGFKLKQKFAGSNLKKLAKVRTRIQNSDATDEQKAVLTKQLSDANNYVEQLKTDKRIAKANTPIKTRIKIQAASITHTITPFK